jgi:hypothetical protein
VRCTHHDTILIGKRLVASVVDIEHAVPHSGPEVVSLGPEQQLKNLGVELSAKWCAIRRLRVAVVGPAGQSRCFVVDEETPVLDGGSLLDLGGLEKVDGVVGLGGYVGEPVPRGDTDLLGNIVDTVDSTTTVAAYEKSVFCISKIVKVDVPAMTSASPVMFPAAFTTVLT